VWRSKDRAWVCDVPRAQIGARSAWLGRSIAIGYAASPAASASGKRREPQPAQKKLQRAVPADAKIAVWAADEHRIGLKPINRGVWASTDQPSPIGGLDHAPQWK